MAHVPTKESYIKKVIRIAKELDISIDKAGITCDAFEEVFSDLQTRQAIFGMIEQLDESAARKGEPLGLIINYGVVVSREGIRVSRYADIPAGEVVNLTPPDQACIFLQIKDDFPTQEVLGSLIVNKLPSLTKGQQSVSTDGMVCSDRDMTESEIATELPSGWGNAPICLGPIRLKFEERFPFVSGAPSRSKRTASMPILISEGCGTLDAPNNLPQWAAMQAGTPAFQSGLSPPPPVGECGHSVSKDVPRPSEIK